MTPTTSHSTVMELRRLFVAIYSARAGPAARLTSMSERLEALDAAIDVESLVTDIRRLIAAPSVVGDEADAQKVFADIAAGLGMQVSTYVEDLDQLRASPDYPGEEVSRSTLVNVTATAPGRKPQGRRLCLSGHIDVVPPGEQPWTTAPFDPRVDDGRIFGRGAADMKAGLVASLHAVAAVCRVEGAPAGDVVVHSVAAEEDGGLGAFALLQRDDSYDGCVIAEPTSNNVVCAHGGALTWHGRVAGRAAHASDRLAGVSALDRFLPIYRALQELEAELNRDVAHPLMRMHALPYPLSVGRVTAGDWPSTVPDELVFEGRVGVPVCMDPADVRSRIEQAVADAADDDGAPPQIRWTGGQFAPSSTDVDHPLVTSLRAHWADVTGTPATLAGVSYGSDMRHYLAHRVPTVMCGPGDLDQAHATDESVDIDAVVRYTKVIARLAATFGGTLNQPRADP